MTTQRSTHPVDIEEEDDDELVVVEAPRRPRSKRCGRRRILFLSIAIPSGIAVSWICWHFFRSGILERHQVAYALSGYCALCAIVLSLWHIYLHLTSYTNPPVQIRMIRIMLMVPLYAAQSWMALRFRHIAIYLDLARDTYESYVLYTFFGLLMVYMDGEQKCIEKLRAKGTLTHNPPFCYYKLNLGARFVWWCKAAITVYAIIKPSVALLAIILSKFHKYKEGDFSPDSAYLWLTLLINFAVTFAFTCLVYFYRATKDILKPYSPGAKFICVKSVVFVSFWQSVVVAILVKFDIIHATIQWNVHEVEMGLQDFLICIEMLFAAIAHRYVFSHRPFLPHTGMRHEFSVSTLAQAIPNPAEVAEDIKELIEHPTIREDPEDARAASRRNHAHASDSSGDELEHRKFPAPLAGLKTEAVQPKLTLGSPKVAP